uniref:Surfeit locus protein 2 n=2 Tax=Parascaris univalens TaxID=6257 RepID=A0A915A728_PARUN
MQDTQLTELIDTYPVFEPIERNKLRCTLTGHELPARGNQLDEYTKSKKFLRAWRIRKIMEDYSDYFDDIGENKYGCKLTMKLVAKDPDDLERHIAGKKFKRALEKALNAADEPHDDGSDEEMGEEDEEDADFDFKDDELSEDDERHDDEDEYPELSRDNGEAVVEGDSYDFAVMDTEKDTTEGTRKRKAEGATGRKKKRTK